MPEKGLQKGVFPGRKGKFKEKENAWNAEGVQGAGDDRSDCDGAKGEASGRFCT